MNANVLQACGVLADLWMYRSTGVGCCTADSMLRAALLAVPVRLCGTPPCRINSRNSWSGWWDRALCCSWVESWPVRWQCWAHSEPATSRSFSSCCILISMMWVPRSDIKRWIHRWIFGLITNIRTYESQWHYCVVGLCACALLPKCTNEHEAH